ncbi:MAG TPA: hypothetical protein VIK10_00190 [Prolixibacteraceae bacterium]
MMKNLTTAEFITIVLSAFALLVSIFAIFGSLYTYCVHDAKLKKQDAKLNKYQLEKIDEEKIRQKRAKIKAEVVSKINTLVTIRITNIGFCEAKDLKIDIQENPDFHIKTNHISKELLRTADHESFELWHLHGVHSKLRLDFTWNDEFQNDNKDYAELILT